jgi:hypothetical protein
LNARMCVCYVDCHGARLCCYLMIHIGNLLHTLHLCYFHLWPIYWLSLVNQPQDLTRFCAMCLRKCSLSRVC